VAIMARLISYFSNKKNIENIPTLFPFLKEKEEECKQLLDMSADKSTNGSLRTFRLMLAAFYHDIGKTIVNHRHGMEGANILADNSSVALYQIEEIVKKYHPRITFTREDLMFISELLLFHDHFGTLSTGETGYIHLGDMASRIEWFKSDIDGKRCLVDLWLLNMADIMVSLKDKWKLQDKTWNNKNKSTNFINTFLECKETVKAKILFQDLIIALKIFDENKENRL
jgi:hypothetical protein